jgi:hypothetical protein
MGADADSQITDLTVNDHACLIFGEPEELFDLIAAFVRDGLSAGLKVVWLSEAGPGPPPLSWRGAGSRWRSGRLMTSSSAW